MRIFALLFITLLLVPCFAGAAGVDLAEVSFIEPQRVMHRFNDSVALSPLKELGRTIFFILESEAGDPKAPYRNLVSRLSFAFSLLESQNFGFIIGGASLQKALLESQAFGERVTFVTRQTNIISTATGPAAEVTVTTNTALARYALLYTNAPRYYIEARIVDGTEDPSRIESKRVFGSFLIGNFLESVTLEGAFRWRESIAYLSILVTVFDFRNGESRSQGAIRAQIIKKDRGRSFSVRYSSRAAGSYDSDFTTAVTFEAALTEATLMAFSQALANLYGIPLSKFSNQPDDERNRASVEQAWVLASTEGRQKALSLRNRLAAECGEAPEKLASPMAAARWRESLELPTLRWPAQPFTRFPAARMGRRRNECRIVFEQFPKHRWQALRQPVAKLLAEFPKTKVEADPLEPNMAFRLKSRDFLPLRALDLEEIKRLLMSRMHDLSGNSVDSQVVGKTLYVKFRSSLSVMN